MKMRNKPVLILLFLLLPGMHLFAQNVWAPLAAGMDNDVYAIAEYNGELYAGGNFNMADNQQANHIAKWDGSSWQPVGGGLNAVVWSLAVYNGELYAGGFFSNYGSGIARWDGANWHDVGFGVNNGVYAMCVYNGKLFVGGKFSGVGSISANHIAAWDGTSWTAPGSGTDGATPWVLALTTYQNQLIVGGEFTSAGGSPAHYIASWNDTVWSPMGPSTATENWPRGVYSLCSFNNELYAGGNMDTIGLTPVQNIGLWNGSAWTNPGINTNNPVYAMVTDGSNLIIGGYFNTPGLHIFSWNGVASSSFGSGLNSYINALCFYNGHLFAGGAFTTSGATLMKRIAYWTPPLGISENSDADMVSVYPDPNDGNMTFHFKKTDKKREVEFYTVTGQLADRSELNNSEGDVPVNETSLENGVYFYRLIIDGEKAASGKVVIAR